MQCLSKKHEVIGIDKKPYENVKVLDIIKNKEEVRQISKESDAVIHLAWDTRESGLSQAPPIRENRQMAEILLDMALANKIPRFILASSVHVSFGLINYIYPGIVKDHSILHGVKITEDAAASAQASYGASKIYLEKLCEAYSKKGLQTIAVRFGNVTPDNTHGEYPFWLSHRDLCQFMEKCLEAENLPQFSTFFAISNNSCNPFDSSHSEKTLGYEPQDGSPCPMQIK